MTWLIAGSATAAWFCLFGLWLWIYARNSVVPDPPTQEFGGSESPAVVGLLAARWKSVERPGESTLIDLAARGYLELRQMGDDPRQTTIHLKPAPSDELAPYERRVLDHLVDLAMDGVVPLRGISSLRGGEAEAWNRGLREEVIAEARRQGLSQSRLPAPVQLFQAVLAIVPAITLAIAAGPALWVLVGLFSFMSLAILGLSNCGERDTLAGRAAAARWLGLRAFLEGDESFSHLPPVAVAIWGRYLAYGNALDTNPICSSLINLGGGNPRKFWSSFGGAWHRVRVRYPGWGGWLVRSDDRVLRSLVDGGTATYVLPAGGVLLGIMLLFVHDQLVKAVPILLSPWADQGTGFFAVGLMAVSVVGHWLRFPRLWGRYGQTSPRLIGWSLGLTVAGLGLLVVAPIVKNDVIAVGTILLGLGLLLRGVYRLVRTVTDLISPVTFEGEILLTRVWRSSSRGMGKPRRVWLYYLVVDDGRRDRLKAWALSTDLHRACTEGDQVRVTARRWSRRVTALRQS